MRQWWRSERALLVTWILGVMLMQIANAGWRPIPGTLLAILILADVGICTAIATVIHDDDAYNELRGRWGENGTRWSMSEEEFEDLVLQVESPLRHAQGVAPSTSDAERARGHGWRRLG